MGGPNVAVKGPLDASKLISVVCSAAPGWKAADKCCEALRKRPSTVLQGRPVKRTHLERIYRIRLSRPEVAKRVIGSDRLLSDLAAWRDEDLTMIVLDSSDGLTYCMLLNETADRLITCFIAPDPNVASKLSDLDTR